MKIEHGKSMEQKFFLPQMETVREIQEYVCRHLPVDYQTQEAAGRVELILEEVIINIVNYAFLDMENGIIKVGVETKDASVKIEICDNGVPFNPLEKEDPDVTAEVEDREIGGLGIFFVRQLSKDVKYCRKDDYNILHLIL